MLASFAAHPEINRLPTDGPFKSASLVAMVTCRKLRKAALESCRRLSGGRGVFSTPKVRSDARFIHCYNKLILLSNENLTRNPDRGLDGEQRA